MNGENAGVLRRPASGSETREKTRVMTFRVTEENYRQIDANARAAGVSRGEFLRNRAEIVTTIQPKRKPLDKMLLAKLLAELNKTGSNIAQILRRVNFGDLVLRHEIEEAFAGYQDMREAVLAAMYRRDGR